MNSRWQANKIGLINFWYYDEQEFPFVKGRMLLRGSNGSGKSVTMQSVVPLLLDGNMSPERLDPFGSRDRKMSSYLLEEDDGREERTGYLYLEFKREDSDTYLTIGMGIRARRRKNLDKWYFSLTDGRRIGKDFFLYKETGEKVTLSKKELENRIGNGGKVLDRQAEYMDYVNRQIFGFETLEEYKEMIDLLIQLRTPKLSKDFKPSVINDILSNSLQSLSDEDLRPMSEAIENMDNMSMNLKGRKEAYQAAEKINMVFSKYNKKVLYEKAQYYEQMKNQLGKSKSLQKENEKELSKCNKEVEKLSVEIQQIDVKKGVLEKERESLGKSDAFALKTRQTQLIQELENNHSSLTEKEKFLSTKKEKYIDTQSQLKVEEDKVYEKENELKDLLDEMQEDAQSMAFEEHTFMQTELMQHVEEGYSFELHRQQYIQTKEKIEKATEILAKMKDLERQNDENEQKQENYNRQLDALQKKVTELEMLFVQTQNEWKESLYRWNETNTELKLEKDALREFSDFADSYEWKSDFSSVREKIAGIKIEKMMEMELKQTAIISQMKQLEIKLDETLKELKEWENQKEPEPERSEGVIKNRQRLDALKIPYQEFYKMIEFGQGLDEDTCNHLEEVLSKMGILDAIIVDEQYKEQVLCMEKGCEDKYLFTGNILHGESLLDVFDLNDELNDIFSNQRLTKILGSIAYKKEDMTAVLEDGTYQLGVIRGTVTGEYQAKFIGTKARKKHRLEKIEQCKVEIDNLQQQIENLQQQKEELDKRKEIINQEYDKLPIDADMREALRMLMEEERELEQIKWESKKLEKQQNELKETLTKKKKEALELVEALNLPCSYEALKEAKKASENYNSNFIRLKAVREMFLNGLETIQDKKNQLEEIDADMEQIRYDISHLEKEIQKRTQERESIESQLKLTDYEAIQERLDYCVSWLNSYPKKIQEETKKKTQKEEVVKQLKIKLEENSKRIEEYEQEVEYSFNCYEQERKLRYVEIPEEVLEDVEHIRLYLESDVKTLSKTTIISNLNKVFFENSAFLRDYQLTLTTLFDELETEKFSAKRQDISARYQGVKISFASLLTHLKEDITELESLIKDGDRELFEDILANTVSRKIRGKINASNTWVKKMNALMNSMNTSSGLKLSLKWRSKNAEKEEQLDTKELVELLKKDYRLMSEEEATRLSTHFRSKVEEARRNAKDSAGMASFYQIMKEALDYRKWFEFQLFSQKSGERQKELTNSVFGTFSGGEKAMSMYVPLFSAVVAKYQGGRKDAPRLISLDEAFAGVDNRNIRDMFRLMTEFQFDFIINSQVLWGDCDTLDALAIYQLIRPENAKFVTVMPYLWNGKKKELLEDEEDVEQRGIELGAN